MITTVVAIIPVGLGLGVVALQLVSISATRVEWCGNCSWLGMGLLAGRPEASAGSLKAAGALSDLRIGFERTISKTSDRHLTTDRHRLHGPLAGGQRSLYRGAGHRPSHPRCAAIFPFGCLAPWLLAARAAMDAS